MDYIKDLRAVVGHRPLILISAMILVLDEADRLLFQHRAGTGAWHVPGGYMEPGEAIEDTARREVLEETGLQVGEMELLGVFSGQDFYWEYPNGDQVYNVTVAFITRDVRGELSADGTEGVDVRFIELDALPDNLGPPAEPVLRKFISRHGAWRKSNS